MLSFALLHSSSSPKPQFHFHSQNQTPKLPFQFLHFSPFTVLPIKLQSKPSFLSLSASLPSSTSLIGDEFEVELGRLLTLLPEEMRRSVSEHPEFCYLIEVVMDLGRKPLARFPSGDFILSDHPITLDDLQHAISKVKIKQI